MPRRRRPDAPTASERKAASRSARAARAIELPAETWTALRAIQARDGDPSATAAAVRVIEAAARGSTPATAAASA